MPRLLIPLVLILGCSLALLAGVYDRQFGPVQAGGSRNAVVSGLYRTEHTDRFTYASTKGDALPQVPQTGAGYFVIRLRMEGPLGHIPITAHLATPAQHIVLGTVRTMRVYQVLLPTTIGGDMQVRIQSPTTKVKGDGRRLGLLLASVDLRSVGRLLPPLTLLWSTPIVLLLLWLGSGCPAMAFRWRLCLLLLGAIVLGAIYTSNRGRLFVHASQLIGAGGLATAVMLLARPTSRRSVLNDMSYLRRQAVEGLATRGRALEAHPLIARWKWITFPVVLFLCMHLTLLAGSKIGLTVDPNVQYETGSREFLRQYRSLDGLCRWDCLWFRKIAEEGYADVRSTNFFPLLPLLARGLYEVSGLDLNFALLIVANLASLGSFLLIYRIFCSLEGEDAARWGLSLFAVYPFAYFQAGGFSEPLLIFFTALAILLALRGNHMWAGLALGLGILSKQLAILAGPALVTAQLRQRGTDPKRLLLNPAILGLLIPLLCLGLYSLYLFIKFDDPISYWTIRDTWGPLSRWGLINLLTTMEQNEHIPIMYSYLPFVSSLVLGSIALTSKKQWSELASFALAYMAFLLIGGIWAIGRHSASTWPAFLPFGVWLSKHPKWQAPVIAVLAVFQGVYFFLTSHGFPVL